MSNDLLQQFDSLIARYPECRASEFDGKELVANIEAELRVAMPQGAREVFALRGSIEIGNLAFMTPAEMFDAAIRLRTTIRLDRTLVPFIEDEDRFYLIQCGSRKKGVASVGAIYVASDVNHPADADVELYAADLIAFVEKQLDELQPSTDLARTLSRQLTQHPGPRGASDRR